MHGVGTVVHPLFAVKSTTMLDSPKCLYIGAYNMAIFFLSGISPWTLFIINIEKFFHNNSPIFASNSFHQAKVCVNLGLFLGLCHIHHSMSCLFYVCGRGYVSYSLYHSFHIFVHVRCNILRCKKKDVDKKRSSHLQRSRVTLKFRGLSTGIEDGKNLRCGRFFMLSLIPANRCCLWNN